ncbi:NAD(P)-dependent oxidoreductase [Cryobacterium sp. N19]|uniref:NAD(P)-dependent oxidoreductase n=1 Tax=Cryobacterium sp. N19 TaxID=2048288 RepID=UPI0018ED25B4|nr:NAD(P)-dependent oxidoreductase [Cryobacterium sp. N19]
MPKPDKRTVAFIGLGNMGLPMASRLIKGGYNVVGFDLSPDAKEKLTEAGGRPVHVAKDSVAGAQIVILMLPNSSVVESVLLQDGVAANLEEGSVVVDMSSSEPLATRELEAVLRREYTVDLVDAPVSGGVKGAVNGTLTIMAGGREESLAKVSAALAILGNVTHTGDVGSGHALKALNNLLSATHLLATSEAMLAGQLFGLDPQVMLSVLNGSSGRSGSTENKWPNFILPQTYDSGFGLRLMVKDMKIASSLFQQLGLPSFLGKESVRLWEEAAEQLPATADHTEIVRWLRDESKP